MVCQSLADRRGFSKLTKAWSTSSSRNGDPTNFGRTMLWFNKKKEDVPMAEPFHASVVTAKLGFQTPNGSPASHRPGQSPCHSPDRQTDVTWTSVPNSPEDNVETVPSHHFLDGRNDKTPSASAISSASTQQHTHQEEKAASVATSWPITAQGAADMVVSMDTKKESTKPKTLLKTTHCENMDFSQINGKLRTLRGKLPAGHAMVLVFTSEYSVSVIQKHGFRVQEHGEGGGGFYCVRHLGTFDHQKPTKEWGQNVVVSHLGPDYVRDDQSRLAERMIVCSVPEKELRLVRFPEGDVRNDEMNLMPLWYWPKKSIQNLDPDQKGRYWFLTHENVNILEIMAMIPSETQAEEGEDVADAIYLEGLELLEGEKPAIAEAFQKFQDCLQMRIKLLGEFHVDVAFAMERIGFCLSSNQQPSDALKRYEMALSIMVAEFGKNHEAVAALCSLMASAHEQQNNFEEAHDCFRKALSIRIGVLGENHPSVADTLNSLGSVSKHLGQFVESRECYSRVVDIQIKHLGEDHAYVAAAFNNLGNACTKLGDHTQAKESLHRSLQIWIKLLGSEHPAVAASYTNLSNLHRSLHEFKAAKQYAKKSVEIKKKLLGAGKDHYDIAVAVYNVANLCEVMGDEEEARKMYLESGGIFARLRFNDKAEDAFEGAERCGGIKMGCCSAMFKKKQVALPAGG